MKTTTITCVACAILASAGAAQTVSGGGSASGRSLVGRHVSVALPGNGVFFPALEVGAYSFSGGNQPSASAFGTGFVERTKRKLYHATFATRREWTGWDRSTHFYAAAGPAVYLERETTAVSEFGTNGRAPIFKSSAQDWQVGGNVGAGLEVRHDHWPAGLQLDARFHVVPFSTTGDTRTLFTLSAGVSFF